MYETDYEMKRPESVTKIVNLLANKEVTLSNLKKSIAGQDFSAIDRDNITRNYVKSKHRNNRKGKFVSAEPNEKADIPLFEKFDAGTNNGYRLKS